MNTEFDDIRPYRDHEVTTVLKTLLADDELYHSLGAWLAPKLNRRYPWLLRPLFKAWLGWQFRGVKTIAGFQPKLRAYLGSILDKSVESLSVSGLDKLDATQGGYLFVSNHRDIVMDPAMVNWALYHAGFETVRIAIGDNLLSKPFVTHLMRLNKSFIVKRSVKGMKARWQAAQQLSRYIHHSIVEERSNVWIAQREGRAKDGYDKTNPAVIGMFSLSCPKDRDYASYINELRIVPVTISYEVDPLDLAKARELFAQNHKGGYQKKEHEDMRSIAKGMTGWKGRVHLAFGDVIQGDFSKDSEVSQAIDNQIHRLYRPFETHQWAYGQLTGRPITPSNENTQQLADRIQSVRDELKPYLLRQYANGVCAQQGEPPFSHEADR